MRDLKRPHPLRTNYAVLLMFTTVIVTVIVNPACKPRLSLMKKVEDGTQIEVDSGPPLPTRTESECDFAYIPHDTPPRVKEGVFPEPPNDVIEGEILLHLFVDKQGNVTNACVAKSLEPAVDRSVLEAARKTTFYPALKDDEPVGVWIVYPVRFLLKD